jgi:cytochrome c oxidase subunit 2
MAIQSLFTHKRVLIVSSHPLFGEGLKRLLLKRPEADVQVIAIVSSIDEAMIILKQRNANLIVVDYDDSAVNKEEFLTRFVESDHSLRVVLLSLMEGGSDAVIYDRRTLAASQVNGWLNDETTNTPIEGKVDHEKSIQSLDKRNRSSGMKHGIGAGILIVILFILGLLVLNTDWLLPTGASLQAGPIDDLFSLHFIVIAFLFALIIGLLIYSLIFFRRKPDDLSDGAFFKHNNKLEILWTVIPLIVVISFAVIGSDVLAQTQRIDPDALEVRVTGQQWSWRFEYPDYGIISTELILPVDQQVLLLLTSNDVIHSFWVPEFRVKQDALPGMERELRVTPSEIGDYTLMCAELCGREHAYMNAPVRVTSNVDFNNWISDQLASVSDDPIERGNVWYNQFGCFACHSIDGTKKVGPTFLGAYGKTETFEDGSSSVIDDAYLRESIINPSAKIVQGFTDAMPKNFSEQLTESQVADLIEFIKSLK